MKMQEIKQQVAVVEKDYCAWRGVSGLWAVGCRYMVMLRMEFHHMVQVHMVHMVHTIQAVKVVCPVRQLQGSEFSICKSAYEYSTPFRLKSI